MVKKKDVGAGQSPNEKQFQLTRDQTIQIISELQTMFEQFWEIVQPFDDLRIRRFLMAKDRIHFILAGLK